MSGIPRLGDDRDQPRPRRLGHAAPQRVGERGHRQHRADPVAVDAALQLVEIHAHVRQAGDLHHLQAHGLHDLQRPVEGGRLERHRVPRARHRQQAQVERFRGAARDHEVVGREVAAPGQRAPRDLLAQREQPGRHLVAQAALAAARRGRDGAAQRAGGEERRVGRGVGQVDDARVARGVVDAGHQLRDLDLRGGGVGGHHGRARRGRSGPQPDEVARARPRLDEAEGLELGDGGEDGGDRGALLGGQPPDRGEAIARREGALLDGRGVAPGDLLVPGEWGIAPRL